MRILHPPLLLSSLAVLAHAQTLVEDTDSSISYSPAGQWNQGNTCAPGCTAQPAYRNMISGGSWKDVSRSSSDSLRSLSFSFTGNAIQATGIMVPVEAASVADTDLQFLIDGNLQGGFHHDAASNTSSTTGPNGRRRLLNPRATIITTGFTYGVQVFQSSGLSQGQHTFQINVQPNSMFLFDALQYSSNPNAAPPPSSSPSAPNSPSNSPSTSPTQNSNSPSSSPQSSSGSSSNSQGSSTSTSSSRSSSTNAPNGGTTVIQTVAQAASGSTGASVQTVTPTPVPSKTPIGAIVGGVVGGVVALAAILALLFYFLRRRTSDAPAAPVPFAPPHHPSYDEEPFMPHTAEGSAPSSAAPMMRNASFSAPATRAASPALGAQYANYHDTSAASSSAGPMMGAATGSQYAYRDASTASSSGRVSPSPFQTPPPSQGSFSDPPQTRYSLASSSAGPSTLSTASQAHRPLPLAEKGTAVWEPHPHAYRADAPHSVAEDEPDESTTGYEDTATLPPPPAYQRVA